MDDLISRTEIISTFTELGKTGRYGGMCEWVIEIVKQLPPAELSTDLAQLGTDCISRQQAIDAVMECYDNDELFEVYEDRLNSLPPTQPEIKQQAINSSDCIDRRAAIDALRKMQTYKMFSGDDMLLIDQAGAQTELMLLPPIQPKRGRWHYSDGKPARIGLSFGVVCDQCGTESEYCTNFCGECGADMREVTT